MYRVLLLAPLLGGCITASTTPRAYATLPADRHLTGRVPVVVHNVDRARLAQACRNVADHAGGYDSSVNGCMITGSKPCTVFVLNENPEEARQVELHERLHCQGWRHH